MLKIKNFKTNSKTIKMIKFNNKFNKLWRLASLNLIKIKFKIVFRLTLNVLKS